MELASEEQLGHKKQAVIEELQAELARANAARRQAIQEALLWKERLDKTRAEAESWKKNADGCANALERSCKEAEVLRALFIEQESGWLIASGDAPEAARKSAQRDIDEALSSRLAYAKLTYERGVPKPIAPDDRPASEPSSTCETRDTRLNGGAGVTGVIEPPATPPEAVCDCASHKDDFDCVPGPYANHGPFADCKKSHKAPPPKPEPPSPTLYHHEHRWQMSETTAAGWYCLDCGAWAPPRR